MNGEFRGDISRDIFDPKKHFSRVLMQQGRVQLDADWNEQTDILLHYIQTLAKDLIGPFAGPDGKEYGFEIMPSGDNKTFIIGYGRYYVDGILCENEIEDSLCKTINSDPLGYEDQLDYPIKTIQDGSSLTEGDLPLLVYLDVWERHISHVEDDSIREKALGGPDTTTRSKVICQVKVLKSDTLKKIENWEKNFNETKTCKFTKKKWPDIEKILQPLNRGCLKAQAKKLNGNERDPCIISPESRYRGAENQLYRVEIHRGGKADGNDKSATFKWSRDNGANVFPINSISGNEVTLENLGRDDRSSLNVGDRVEVIDDNYTLLIQSRPSPVHNGPTPLARVMSVSLAEMKVTLDFSPNYQINTDKHPLLRRWDFKESSPAQSDQAKLAEENGHVFGLYVQEGDSDVWLNLEDGVQICFRNNGKENLYQAGDYWLIPARRDTGDVEWPYTDKSKKERAALPPHGVDHHYAPLGIIYQDEGTDVWKVTPCRCKITPSTDCANEGE